MQNTMELQIGKWGNSLGIRLPKYILETLKLNAKDKIACSLEDGKIILSSIPKTKKYKLKKLLDQVQNPNKEISWGKPEGEEVW